MPPARLAWKHRRARGSLAAPSGSDRRADLTLTERGRPCVCSLRVSGPKPTPSRRCRRASRRTGTRPSSTAMRPAMRPIPSACRCTSGASAPRRRGTTVIEGLCAFAQPAGRTIRRVYEGYRDRILQQAEGRAPAQPRAGQHARRDGGGGLRRLRGRPAGRPARGGGPRRGDRRRARPPLPHHAADAGGRDRACHL